MSCVCPFPTSLHCILQIQKVVLALGDYMNAQCHACIGGTVVREDMRKLEAGVHIVVGTPGRVYDMINRRALGRWFSGVWGTGVPSESSQQQNKCGCTLQPCLPQDYK